MRGKILRRRIRETLADQIEAWAATKLQAHVRGTLCRSNYRRRRRIRKAVERAKVRTGAGALTVCLSCSLLTSVNRTVGGGT